MPCGPDVEPPPFTVDWIRREGNQYPSTPLEIAKTRDDDILKVMGYQMGGAAGGSVSDFLDPLSVVLLELGAQQYDFDGRSTVRITSTRNCATQ